MQPDTPPTEAATPVEPLFVQPTEADRAPRRADKPKPPPKSVPHDPEAPFGWMTDPKTGERRPKKTAGRQVKAARGKPVAAPRERPANRARTASPATVVEGVPSIPPPNHAEQVGRIIDVGWMLGASVPAMSGKFLGIDFHRIEVTAKAQVGVLKDTRDQTARGIGAIADHVGIVGRGVEKLAAEDGPAWILVAAMALIPLISASAALYRMPLAEIEQRAAKTDAEWATFVAVQMGQAGAGTPAIEGEAIEPGAMFPGGTPLIPLDELAA